MSYSASSRFHEPEQARVQAHAPPSSTTVATARSLHTSQRGSSSNGTGLANGHTHSNGVLPAKSITLASSTRGGHSSLNSTRIDARAGHTATHAAQRAAALKQAQTQAQTQGPIPSHALHPNHITDVFPDTLTALTRTEEHSYSSARPDHDAEHSHSHSRTIPPTVPRAHNPYAAPPLHTQHRIPLRMPQGPTITGPAADAAAPVANLFDQLNTTGMDDSVYANGHGHGTYANGGPNGSSSSASPTFSSSSTAPADPTPLLSAALAADRIQPLQRENLRLVRSNNALQAHLVSEGERMDAKEKEWAAELREIKTKHTDLQFLHAQKTRKIANQESKIHELQSRLEQVLSDRQAYVKESVEVSARLPPGPIFAQPGFVPPSRRVEDMVSNAQVDLMRAQESKLAEMRAELSAAEERARKWEEERATLLSRIETRDAEVRRLGEVIESERNWDKIQAEFELKRQHKSIQKLEAQLDYLNEQRVAWEKDAQSFREMGVSAHYVSQLNESRAETTRTKQQVEQLQKQLASTQQELEAARARAEKLEASKVGVDERVHRAVQESEARAREEIHDLQRSLDDLRSKLDESEQHSLDKSSRITSLEHELHLLSHASSTKVSELTSASQVLQHNQELISKLNGQVTELRGVCRALEAQKGKVEAEWRLGQAELEQTKTLLAQAMERNTQATMGVQDKGQEVVQLREHSSILAEEKHQLSVELSKRDARIHALSEEVQQASLERDRLLQSLAQADETLATVQTELSDLHSAREEAERHYANLYEDFQSQVAQLAELRQQKFPQVQEALARMQEEKSKLQAQLRDLQSNKLEQLELAESQQRAEVARLKSTQSELLARLESEQERLAQAQGRIVSLEAELHGLAHTASTKGSQLSSNATLLEHHTDLISRLNLQITDLKSVCRAVEAQKTQVESQWRHALGQLEKSRQDLQEQMQLHTSQSILLQEKSQECTEMRAQVNAMAEEQQRLQQELRAREDQIEQLHAETSREREGKAKLSSLLTQGDEASSALQESLRSKEYELGHLVAQLQSIQRSHSAQVDQLALKDADLKSVVSDLENVLKENQMLTAEMSQLKAGMESRALDAERSHTRALHAEELYKAKEGECMDLLSNYRSVTLEIERMKLASQELEQERLTHRQALKTQADALFQHEVALKSTEAELRKRMLDLHSMEQANQDLSRSLEQSKASIDTLHAEKRQLAQALEAARMVASGLEHSRNDQDRAQAEARAALTKAQMDHQAALMDNQHLATQLAQSKAHVTNLEHIISSLRAQSLESSTASSQGIQEKSARIAQMQQELQQAHAHIDTMQAQISSLNQYREQQNQEIHRWKTLLQRQRAVALAAAVPPIRRGLAVRPPAGSAEGEGATADVHGEV